MTNPARKTFFDLVDKHGRTGLAELLDIDKSTISRCYNLKQGINERVIDRCLAVFGEEFDRDGTAALWLSRRLKRAARQRSQTTAEV